MKSVTVPTEALDEGLADAVHQKADDANRQNRHGKVSVHQILTRVLNGVTQTRCDPEKLNVPILQSQLAQSQDPNGSTREA